MSQFQAVMTSRDSSLNMQTLVLVVFIDCATMPMPELTNAIVENVPCANETRKILLLIMCIVFLK